MINPFPARHSTLEPDHLASYVESYWNLGSQIKCTFFHRGENDNYRIESERGKFCLRVWRSRHSSDLRVVPQLSLLKNLNRIGMPVSHAVADRDGELWRTVSAIEGPRALTVFTWAPGRPLSRDNPNNWDVFGRQLAALHLAAIPTPGLPEFSLESLLIAPSQWWSQRLLESGLDSSELLEITECLVRDMDGVWEQLPRTLVHGDAAGGNAHVDESGQLTWFDFLWSGSGPAVWDLGTFRRGAGQLAVNWDSMLAAYETVRPLSEAERYAIPLLAAIRCVFVTSLIIDECDLDLESEATGEWFDRRIRELRRLVDGSHWTD